MCPTSRLERFSLVHRLIITLLHQKRNPKTFIRSFVLWLLFMWIRIVYDTRSSYVGGCVEWMSVYTMTLRNGLENSLQHRSRWSSPLSTISFDNLIQDFLEDYCSLVLCHGWSLAQEEKSWQTIRFRWKRDECHCSPWKWHNYQDSRPLELSGVRDSQAPTNKCQIKHRWT